MPADPTEHGPPASGVPAIPVHRTGRNVAIVLASAVVLGAGFVAARTMLGPELPTPKIHRAAAAACGASVRARGLDPELVGCKSDAECTKGANGRCERDMVGHAHFENRCRYDRCSTDDDCRAQGDIDGEKGPCICGEKGEVNACVAGNCRTDADCGRRGFCSPSRDFVCGHEGGSGYFCHTADDVCTDDADCAGSAAGKGAECRYDPEAKRWACTAAQCRRY